MQVGTAFSTNDDDCELENGKCEQNELERVEDDEKDSAPDQAVGNFIRVGAFEVSNLNFDGFDAITCPVQWAQILNIRPVAHPMRILVRSSERFHSKEGWLETYWHFSFDHYYDRSNLGWGALRVFNDDYISPGGKFGLHPHANYEILTVMIGGEMEHRDDGGEGRPSGGSGASVRSGGHSGILGPCDVQAMSAGSGVFHSEANAGKIRTHSLQIWIEPEKKGGKPAWKSHAFKPSDLHNCLCPMVSGLPAVPAPLQIRQKAVVYRASLQAGHVIAHSFSGSHGYVFVISGELKSGRDVLLSADSMKIKDETKIGLAAGENGADFILLDLP